MKVAHFITVMIVLTKEALAAVSSSRENVPPNNVCNEIDAAFSAWRTKQELGNSSLKSSLAALLSSGEKREKESAISRLESAMTTLKEVCTEANTKVVRLMSDAKPLFKILIISEGLDDSVGQYENEMPSSLQMKLSTNTCQAQDSYTQVVYQVISQCVNDFKEIIENNLVSDKTTSLERQNSENLRSDIVYTSILNQLIQQWHQCNHQMNSVLNILSKEYQQKQLSGANYLSQSVVNPLMREKIVYYEQVSKKVAEFEQIQQELNDQLIKMINALIEFVSIYEAAEERILD